MFLVQCRLHLRSPSCLRHKSQGELLIPSTADVFDGKGDFMEDSLLPFCLICQVARNWDKGQGHVCCFETSGTRCEVGCCCPPWCGGQQKKERDERLVCCGSNLSGKNVVVLSSLRKWQPTEIRFSSIEIYYMLDCRLSFSQPFFLTKVLQSHITGKLICFTESLCVVKRRRV